MTLSGKLFALFPAIHISSILASFYLLCSRGEAKYLLLFLTTIYALPVICFRVLTLIKPMNEGVSDILSKDFSPWWAGHQMQSLFIAVPALEAILKIIPGFYSFWLRCWGSKIGKNVYWTPGVLNYDRNLLEVGNGVIFGEQSLTVCHVITPKKGQGLLKISKVRIGDSAFVGAGSVISPGVTMDKGTFVKAGERIYPHWHITKEGTIKPARKKEEVKDDIK